jgi:small-conductance mechanosensitive channel
VTPAAGSGLGGLDLPAVTGAGLALSGATLVVAVVLGQLCRLLLTRVLCWRGRSPSSARVFGRLSSWVITLLGVAAALTILFPSVQPVNILGGVGIISIAAGIAFQTVLGNMFAGIVILARDRFRVGDQIAVEEHRGNVVQMGLTSTSIRTFDGRLVLVPNSTLHSRTVTVQTGFEHVRGTVTLVLAPSADLDHAVQVALAALAQVPEVYADPPPQARLAGVEPGAVTMEVQYWSGARQLETKEATHAVIRALLTAAQEHDLALADGSTAITLGRPATPPTVG